MKYYSQYIKGGNYVIDIDSGSCYSSNISEKQIRQQEKIENNLLKNLLVSSGKYDQYRGKLYANYSKYCADTYGTELNKKYACYLGADLQLSEHEQHLCYNIYQSKAQRSKRLRDRVKKMLLTGNCLFLTLTFNDDFLNNTIKSYRRKAIQRYLKSLDCVDYVANIDFGDKEKNSNSNEREHYHAIIVKDRIDLDSYKYGFIFAEKIKNTSNCKALAKYITKLSAHAYKDSTKGLDRLIYKRS